MKLMEEILTMPAKSGMDASTNFQYPLQELEAYISHSQNPKLADSFRKFKEALFEPDADLVNATAPSVQLPSAVNNKPQPEERSYLAMSSLFSANVKHW